MKKALMASDLPTLDWVTAALAGRGDMPFAGLYIVKCRKLRSGLDCRAAVISRLELGYALAAAEGGPCRPTQVHGYRQAAILDDYYAPGDGTK
jgi:hypothetical protein